MSDHEDKNAKPNLPSEDGGGQQAQPGAEVISSADWDAYRKETEESAKAAKGASGKAENKDTGGEEKAGSGGDDSQAKSEKSESDDKTDKQSADKSESDKSGAPDDAGKKQSDGKAGDQGSDERDSKQTGKLDDWTAKRIAREKAKATRADKTAQELAERIRELEAVVAGRSGDEAGQGQSGKQGKQDSSANAGESKAASHVSDKPMPREQYEKYLGEIDVDSYAGPDPQDYADNKLFAEDYQLFMADKPLKHHPKVASTDTGQGKAGGQSGEQKSGQDNQDAGSQGKQLSAEERQILAKRQDNWHLIQQTFVEKETGPDDSAFDELVEGVSQGSIRLDDSALDAIADLEAADIIDATKALVEAPSRGLRVVRSEDKKQAVAEMIAGYRKGSGRSEKPGDKPNHQDDGTDDFEPIQGGRKSHGGGTKDPSDMSYAEFEAFRRKQLGMDEE